MRTIRTLTVSPSTLCSGGVLSPRGVYLVPGDVLSPEAGVLSSWGELSPRGVYLVWGVYSVPGVYLVLGMSAPGGVNLVLEGGVCSKGVSAPGECTWSLGCLHQGGVCIRGCLLKGGVCSMGVSAPGGYLVLGGLLKGGVCSGGCLLHAGCVQSCMLLKILPCPKLHLRAVKTKSKKSTKAHSTGEISRCFP